MSPTDATGSWDGDWVLRDGPDAQEAAPSVYQQKILGDWLSTPEPGHIVTPSGKVLPEDWMRR